MTTQDQVKRCEQIVQYSLFNTDQFGNTLARIISSYEGIPYCYQTAWHDTTMQNISITNMAVLIIPEEITKKHYLKDDFKNRNDILILQKDKQPTIRFYKSFGSTVYSTIELKQFTYIEPLIEQIIAYRIKHHTNKIPEEILEEFIGQFLSERIDQIKENYAKREQQEIEEVTRKLEQKKRARQYQLQNILHPKK